MSTPEPTPDANTGHHGHHSGRTGHADGGFVRPGQDLVSTAMIPPGVATPPPPPDTECRHLHPLDITGLGSADLHLMCRDCGATWTKPRNVEPARPDHVYREPARASLAVNHEGPPGTYAVTSLAGDPAHRAAVDAARAPLEAEVARLREQLAIVTEDRTARTFERDRMVDGLHARDAVIIEECERRDRAIAERDAARAEVEQLREQLAQARDAGPCMDRCPSLPFAESAVVFCDLRAGHAGGHANGATSWSFYLFAEERDAARAEMRRMAVRLATIRAMADHLIARTDLPVSHQAGVELLDILDGPTGQVA